MISAEQFLDLLEEKDLLPAKVLLTLRQQIDQAGKPVAATTVARELIKAGHLTPALAERLLTSQQQAKEEEPEPVDELGLAPLEEDEKSKKKSAPKTPPPEEDLGLTPLDDVPCNDNNTCTKADACRNGTCVGQTYNCSDSLSCTTDSCDGLGKCSYVLKPAYCKIENACYKHLETDSTGCKICDVSASQKAWKTRPKDSVCVIDSKCRPCPLPIL